MGKLTIDNKNPFALIQLQPDKWQGLKGTTKNGFLIFDTAINGARAGWINLWNTYLSKGINTPNSIIVKYAPDGGGKDGAYSKFIAQRLGITTDTAITTPKQIWELGRAIVYFEAGENWLSDKDLLEGYNLARTRVALPELSAVAPTDQDEKKKRLQLLLTIALPLVAYGLISWRKKTP